MTVAGFAVHRLLVVAVACALALGMAGCGGEGDDPEAASTSESTNASPSTSAPQSSEPAEAALDAIEGTFDVGGHELFMRCEGSGSPTVVYMHGAITDPGVVAHSNATGIMRLLADDYRMCAYDRRNVGDSETVDAPQLPRDALADMHALLDEAGIAPPYVLLGASFGGALAYLYANEHTDDVVGMVLLDAMFPDELSLEHLFPPADRQVAYSKDDEQNGLERISAFKVLKAGQSFIGKEPDIPVTYLASDTEGYEDNDFGIPEYDKRIQRVQAAYVDRFSPGTLIRVDAPHFMEPAIPREIAQALRDVIAQAG